MKKTTTTIAALSLILTLIATAVGQDRRRVPGPKGMNKSDLTEQLTIRSNRQRNRRPASIGNPFGLGGTVSAGITQPSNQGQRGKRKSPTSTGDQPELQVTNSRQQNLGDTATHEVGHKGKRRNVQAHPIPAGDGTTEHFRTNAPKGPLGLTNTTSYDFRNAKNQRKAAQYNPKEIGIDKTRNITPRKTMGFTEVTGLDIQVESKQARRKRH